MLLASGLAAGVLLARYLRKRYSREQRLLRQVTAPPGEWPLIGHTRLFTVCFTRLMCAMLLHCMPLSRGPVLQGTLPTVLCVLHDHDCRHS